MSKTVVYKRYKKFLRCAVGLHQWRYTGKRPLVGGEAARRERECGRCGRSQILFIF